eukprot:12902063-Prorocentrum_lima.AAC.1
MDAEKVETRWRKRRQQESRGPRRQHHEVYNLWFRNALSQMVSTTLERTWRRKRCTNGQALRTRK